MVFTSKQVKYFTARDPVLSAVVKFTLQRLAYQSGQSGLTVPLVQQFVVLHVNVQHPIDKTQVSSNYCNLYIGL